MQVFGTDVPLLIDMSSLLKLCGDTEGFPLHEGIMKDTLPNLQFRWYYKQEQCMSGAAFLFYPLCSTWILSPPRF